MRAVQRACGVLAVLAAADRPLNLTAVAARADLTVTTTFRLLRTLQEQGMVWMRQEDGTYRLGPRVLALSTALLRQLNVVDTARPHLTAMRNAVNETALLCVRMEDEWVRAFQVEATQPLRRVHEIGERLPLYAGCAGKIFLAAMTDDELEEYLARTRLVPLSPTTPTEARTLRKQIAQVRARGFAESVNERGGGGAGVAVAVRDHEGRVGAAIEISAPMTRFLAETRERWLAALRSAGCAISQAMGYEGGADGRGDGGAAALPTEGRAAARAPRRVRNLRDGVAIR
ncbi:MAG: IclR family transcriptional regulator [Chloroflexota bacterium]|nr:IclR family transcriptional regulator [Chloroflexota bacterium]